MWVPSETRVNLQTWCVTRAQRREKDTQKVMAKCKFVRKDEEGKEHRLEKASTATVWSQVGSVGR